jgi:predicted house-cleaning NTP pyrophosphatase (Maf/HAM1 superfamily)
MPQQSASNKAGMLENALQARLAMAANSTLLKEEDSFGKAVDERNVDEALTILRELGSEARLVTSAPSCSKTRRKSAHALRISKALCPLFVEWKLACASVSMV